jgi:all-trans-nonaprenyl-diphosphate synthase
MLSPPAGQSTVHTVFGTRVAVLVGDYLFAQSSWFLANLDNLEVIKLISQVIADFANGEISQAGSLFNTDATLEAYLDKSFYKTASLIAASLRSEAVFSGCTEELKADMFAYGKNLGLAFQIVDDILDFTQSTEQLGKPQGQDLASGNLTAPAILALQSPLGGSRLRELVDSEFQEPGDLQEALALVASSGGLEAARLLAKSHGEEALAALHRLPPCESKRSLELMVDYVLHRIC